MKKCNNVTVKLKIADIIIQMQSDFALEQLTYKERKRKVISEDEQLSSFFYNERQKADIKIKVIVVNKLPKINRTKRLFVTYHFQDGAENWRLFKKDNTYIYENPIKIKNQVILINKTFNRITAYVLPKKVKGWVWSISDIVYDFLQVLLINYFAFKKEGIFLHSFGQKDLDNRGLLFAGKSGSGKSTLARIWHKHSKAVVLNDDRIIVRKFNGKFLIYSTPWRGDFSDYISSGIKSAPFDKLFFIYHASKNNTRRISQIKAFNMLYQTTFATFWDKDSLENIISLSYDLIKTIPCYSLGFVNDKRIIGFVRKIR